MLTLTTSACAISLLARPWAASSATRRSVGVSSPAGEGRRAPTRSSSERASLGPARRPQLVERRRRALERRAGGAPLPRAPLLPAEREQRPRRIEREPEARVLARRRARDPSRPRRRTPRRGRSRAAALSRRAAPTDDPAPSRAPRTRALTARACSSSPRSTSASTSSGATGNDPGIEDAFALGVLPHLAEPLRGVIGLVHEQRRPLPTPAAPRADPSGHRRRGASLGLRRPTARLVGQPRPAARSARHRSYIGQRSSSRSALSAHSSSRRSAASHPPARSSSSHRCRR